MVKLLTILSIVFCVGIAQGSWACPMLEKANPKVGSVVEISPEVVEIKFSTKIFPDSSTLDVFDPTGHKVNVGKPYGKEGDDTMILTKVNIHTPGRYKVQWNVFCDCGAMTPGEYKFDVGTP
ncbi:MAG: copper resistance protein CopC [Alphaproteobacteria bacterium]|nr:copper resistance protein CopC [Alphaproteobacteria bacterium]